MKVLIIGLGSIARKHINALKSISPESSIYGLRSSRKSEDYESVINIYSRDNLESFNFDFVIISSPTSFHLGDIRLCLNLNIPLFVEKPVFNTLKVGNILKETKDIPTYIGCNLRFLDSIQYVKTFVEENKKLKINEVNSYFGSYLPSWRPNIDFRQSYSANENLGGGVHLDLIHEIDYIKWIFGLPNEIHKTLTKKSSLSINSIDYANYTLVYNNFSSSVILNYYRKDSKRFLEILYENFTLEVDLLKNEVFKNGESIYYSNQTMLDTYSKQMKYFLENRTNKLFNNINEAYETLKICL